MSASGLSPPISVRSPCREGRRPATPPTACQSPAIPDAREVYRSEEHPVTETTAAGRYRIVVVKLAIPPHVRPTPALHWRAWVVDGGRVRGRWEITARDRILTRVTERPRMTGPR